MSDDAAPFDIGWDESGPPLTDDFLLNLAVCFHHVPFHKACAECGRPDAPPSQAEFDEQYELVTEYRGKLAAAESSAAQYLREREDLEGALEAIAEHTTDEDTHHIARQALASLPSPEPTQRDREPQPTDGPDYHAEHSAWRRRNFPLATDRRWEKIDHIPSHKSPPDDGVIYLTVDRQPFRVRVGNYHTDTIREAAAVPVDYDLWLVRPGADDVKIAGRVYLSRSGDRFFTTPRYINASSPDPTQGEQ